MNQAALEAALATSIPQQLSRDLVADYLQLRQDVAARTLGRSSAGKFVETLVQVFQVLETGQYEAHPKVDEHLRQMDARGMALDDGLRVCASRLARAMYAIRSKRGIIHKNGVDPSYYDLRLLLSSSQWLLAELLRHSTALPMEETGRLIELLHVPVGALVEDFGDKTTVLAELSAPKEALLIFQHRYPNPVQREDLVHSMKRHHAGTVRKAVQTLYKRRLVEDEGDGFALTQLGLSEARKIIAGLAQ